MQNLPYEFKERMKALLGAEYEAFLASYDQPRHFGLRVNTLKISPQEFEQLAPFHLRRIPWVENGYYYEEQDAPARHPFYYAGLYYLQEPSAMTPASVLPVKPGENVLDLCAAPGGKATELGARLSGQGLLVANDISASRVKALLKNIEVTGITNAFVTNDTPAKLAERFPEFFDKILVDAPCSGEGMFRKDPAVGKVWDAQKPLRCARQQREILGRAVDMLAPGGQLLYSTCTFSPEENEQIIAWLLRERTDMELLDIPCREGFSQGLPWTVADDWEKNIPRDTEETGTENTVQDVTGTTGVSAAHDLKKCVRIFPHKVAGEGHFLALLGKKGDRIADAAPDGSSCLETCRESQNSARQIRNAARRVRKQNAGQSKKALSGNADIQKEEWAVLLDFLKDISCPFEEKHLEIRRGQAYYAPQLTDDMKGIAFLRNGLYLGEVKKNRFEPSQSLAMALSAAQYAHVLNLDYRDGRVLRYLKGETIETDGCAGTGEKGWRLVCVNGYPLGWGKLSEGLLKNKYHAGWRMKP